MVLRSRLPVVRAPENATLHSYFFNTTAKYADDVAFINHHTKAEVTYAQLEEQARFVADALVAMGIAKGEVVTVCVDNRPEVIAILLGASMAGAIMSPMHPKLSADEMFAQIIASHSRFAFVVPQAILNARAAFERIKRDHRLISLGAREDSDGLAVLGDLAHSVAACPAIVLPAIVPEEDVVYLPFSSGIHGEKKAILTTHFVMNAQLAAANHACYDSALRGEFTALLLPFSRHLGIESCLISLLNGATVVTIANLHVPTFMEAIELYEARVAYTSPYIVHLITQQASPPATPAVASAATANGSAPVPEPSLSSASGTSIVAAPVHALNLPTENGNGITPPNTHEFTLASLQTLIVGTASLTRLTHDRFIKRFPHVRIVTIYGMTETGIITRSAPRSRHAKTVGTLAAGLQLKVLDMLSGQELGVREKGLIYVAGPSTSAPYLDHQEMNPFGGWRKTGDIGFFDEDEQIHLIDRAKDMIKVFGYQVTPQEIEEVLATHAAVSECAVVGVGDVIAGERPVAYVVLRPLHKVTKEELLEFVNVRVNSIKQLGRVEIAQRLPRTACGAVLRRVLSEAANLSITNAR